jgi:1,4-dihydroxy-2-naphthoate polyprenyltransferase
MTQPELSPPIPTSAERRRIWIDLLLYPTHTLPTAAAPVLVAVGLAIHDRVFALGPILAAFVGSWCIHVGGVFTDNLVLITRHRHIREHPELLDGLKTGALTVHGLRLATIGWFLASLAVAPYLAGIIGWQTVVALGIVGSLAAVCYAGGPLPYARPGLADPVFFSMFAFVAVPAAYAVQAAAHATGVPFSLADVWSLIPIRAFIAGSPVGALVTNVLLIDEIRDVDFDRAKGWHTGAVRHGRSYSRNELVCLTVLAYVVPLGLWLRGGMAIAVLLPISTLPIAIGVARAVRRAEQFEDLAPLTPRASRLALLYCAMLGIGIALG